MSGDVAALVCLLFFLKGSLLGVINLHVGNRKWGVIMFGLAFLWLWLAFNGGVAL